MLTAEPIWFSFLVSYKSRDGFLKTIFGVVVFVPQNKKYPPTKDFLSFLKLKLKMRIPPRGSRGVAASVNSKALNKLVNSDLTNIIKVIF